MILAYKGETMKPNEILVNHLKREIRRIETQQAGCIGECGFLSQGARDQYLKLRQEKAATQGIIDGIAL